MIKSFAATEMPQSLICPNGSRMSCGMSDKGSRILFLFLIMAASMTVIFIVHVENENIRKNLLIQAKYAVSGSHSYKDPTDTTDDSLSYGIIFDCGSSGTRVYIYYWPPHGEDTHQLLDIHQLIGPDSKPLSKKITPGLSTYDTNSSNSAEYLKPLLEFAAEIIPEHKHKQTPLYILATAGMRLISKEASAAILDDISRDIPGWFDFHFEKSHVEVLSGQMEGLYAWISLNYMLGRFSHGNAGGLRARNKSAQVRQPTVGVIDMGGGSLQIAFEVDQTKMKTKDQAVTFSLGSDDSDLFHRYSLYVTTFLGFGANEALEKHRERLVKHANGSSFVADNCQALGSRAVVEYQDTKYRLKGTGDVPACMDDIKPLMNQAKHCHTKPCSLDGVYQPTIDTDSQFYGISEFWYSTYDVLNSKGIYSQQEVLKRARSYCETPWADTERRWNSSMYPNADMQRMRNQCFKVSWMMEILHDGLHFPKDYKHLLPVSEINGQEVQWSLGALVYRTRFFPAQQESSHAEDRSRWYRQSRIVLPYALLICFVIVIGAIMLYCRHLQRMKVVPSLKNVPSMSYFMTDSADQLEQGIIEEKHVYFNP